MSGIVGGVVPKHVMQPMLWHHGSVLKPLAKEALKSILEQPIHVEQETRQLSVLRTGIQSDTSSSNEQANQSDGRVPA